MNDISFSVAYAGQGTVVQGFTVKRSTYVCSQQEEDVILM